MKTKNIYKDAVKLHDNFVYSDSQQKEKENEESIIWIHRPLAMEIPFRYTANKVEYEDQKSKNDLYHKSR